MTILTFRTQSGSTYILTSSTEGSFLTGGKLPEAVEVTSWDLVRQDNPYLPPEVNRPRARFSTRHEGRPGLITTSAVESLTFEGEDILSCFAAKDLTRA